MFSVVNPREPLKAYSTPAVRHKGVSGQARPSALAWARWKVAKLLSGLTKAPSHDIYRYCPEKMGKSEAVTSFINKNHSRNKHERSQLK